MILGLVSALGARGLALAGVVAAVALVALGLYRAGRKAERMAATVAVHRRLKRDLRTREEITHEIDRDIRDGGGSAADLLRAEWRR